MEQLPRFAPTVGALGDEEVGYFGLNIFIHYLIRDSLAISKYTHGDIVRLVCITHAYIN
jgi:hypothetical protein